MSRTWLFAVALLALTGCSASNDEPPSDAAPPNDGAPIDAGSRDGAAPGPDAAPPSAGDCPLPPKAPALAKTACQPADGTAITKLPFVITVAGSYCLAIDGPADGTSGIDVKADGVTILGRGHSVGGPIHVLDHKKVTVKEVVSTSGIEITATQATTTSDIVVTDSSFTKNGAGALATNGPVRGLDVEKNRFACTCDPSQVDNTCVAMAAVTPGDQLTPLTFKSNVVVSDCVKNVRILGGAVPGGQTPLHHTIEDNFLVSLRDTPGDEVTNITWRNSPGSESNRNSFKNNSIVSEGRANGIYLRDDVVHEDFVGNCVQIKNPKSSPVFYGAILTSSGNDAPFVDPGGLHFIGNKVMVQGAPAITFQGYGEISTDRTLLRGNVLVASGGPAILSGTMWHGLFEHDTFVSTSASAPAVMFDGAGTGEVSEFYDDVFACTNQRDGYRHDCLAIPGGSAAAYDGSNNLFWNTTGGVEVYLQGQLSLKDWMAKGEDVGSFAADPEFVDPPKLDFSLSPASPARGKGRNGTTIGAIP